MKPKAASVSLALALTASLAAAGPVAFTEKALDGSEPWTVSYTLNVEKDAMFSGWLKSVSNKKDNVVVESVLLSKDGVDYLFDLADDEYKFLAVSVDQQSTPGKKGNITHWHWTYELSPVLLSAGEWDVTVNLNNYSNKFNSSLLGAGTLSAVPEPQSLALALGALGALVLVSRRAARRLAR